MTLKRIPSIPLMVFLLFAAGCRPTEHQAASDKWELLDAIPSHVPTPCVPPDDRERSLYELAAAAIELTSNDVAHPLEIGSMRFMSRVRHRGIGADAVAVCTPDDILKRVEKALNERSVYIKGRLGETELEVASRLKAPAPHIVKAVGDSAFNAHIQPSGTLSWKDIRPYARTILAGFGHRASQYRELAYAQMSIADSMGTGAAQVAAATGHPEALPRIEQIMEQALASQTSSEPIRWRTKKRLYELAWAIAFSGDAGRQYTKQIHVIMRRRVESWAPPFGMISHVPKRLCEVLGRIEGDAAVAQYSYCVDDKVALDQ